MRLGYSFHGFLADRKFKNGSEVSTPDGNAAYSWSILHEAQKRGWTTYLMQEDRDLEYTLRVEDSLDCFDSFSARNRYNAWSNTIPYGKGNSFPELDILLLEWRWPIPGRNCKVSKDDPNYQPDLDRQEELLRHYYTTDTKVIIWDLDQKLTWEDENLWAPHAIFETSVTPKLQCIKRTRVEPPIIIDDLLQFPTIPCNPKRKLAYVGSRYERDDVIEEWIKPVSDKFPGEVEFWGNWLREPNLAECKAMWPDISYNKRITMRDFREVYSTAVACPILAKQSYLDTGFITPRPWEALMFGTIPVGLSSHKGIEDYVFSSQIARDGQDLAELVEVMASWDFCDRDSVRRANIEKIRFMDVSNFVNRIEDVLNGRR